MYTYTAEVVKIIDGDSVWLAADVGFRLTFKDNFRLARINTPELRSRDEEERSRAKVAAARLGDLIPVGSKVVIRTAKSGKYGRWIAEVYRDLEGELQNVNDVMLAEGFAVPYGS